METFKQPAAVARIAGCVGWAGPRHVAVRMRRWAGVI